MLGLFIVILLLVLGTVPFLTFVTFLRVRGLEAKWRQRIDGLEATIAVLERKVRALESQPSRPGAEPAAQAPPAAPAQSPPPAPLPVADDVVPHASAPTAPPPEPVRPAPALPARIPIGAETSPGAPPPKFDWERWIGIRGAAVLGAIVLALAGLLFFQYSIQRGLITPAMRVALGVVVGLGCIVGSQGLHRRGYRAGETLAGAGIVILYAAFWAAHELYALLGLGPTFVLMALTTVTGCLLAARRGSQAIAVLGLLGGFATPLFLRSEADHPIGLFGYVLLLDVGLLALGKSKRWPSLALLSLGGTILIQGLWFGARMGPDQLLLGLAILAVFAALFAVSGAASPDHRSRAWLASQAGSVLFPFVFAVYFTSRVDLGPRLYPIAILLALLSAGACWVGRTSDSSWVGLAASLGGLGVLGVWSVQRTIGSTQAWELTAAAAGLALVFHLFVEMDPDSTDFEGPAPAAITSAGGGLVLLVLATGISPQVGYLPWLVGWLALGGLLYRHASFPARAELQLFAAAGAAIGLSVFHVRHATAQVASNPTLFLGVLLGVAALAQAIALARTERAVQHAGEHAAALFAVIALAACSVSPLVTVAPASLLLTWTIALALLALLSAMRLRSGAWVAATGVVTVVAQATVAVTVQRSDPRVLGMTLAFLAAAVALFTVWPFLARKAFADDPVAWIAAALAGPAWFFPLRALFRARFGADFIGLLPVALGAVALGAVAGVRRLELVGPVRRRAVVWFSAVAISFVSIAIPMQLEREWITIGWAAEGLGLIALWRRLDHPGLKWFGVAALGAATLRLVVNPELLSYYPRSGTPIFNWILYTYLVPAAALLGATALLHPLEMARVRDGERALYHGSKPTGTILLGVSAIAVIFVWMNLAIADWFTEGPVLRLQFGRSPARDLTVSIAWAVYALTLLLVGMRRAVTGLRWLSLAFLVVTIGKVFLYDLGELRDLYRVASLVGLALSLIVVSLLYQKLVFGKGGTSGNDSP